jgi:4-hydroxyphenylpyruvate dioxygenase
MSNAAIPRSAGTSNRRGGALGLRSIRHIEFYVGNAHQAAFFYRNAFGFSQIAYAGLETGQRDFTSYVLEQGKARFVLMTPMQAEGPLADSVKKHGDFVRDIAFRVDDCTAAFREAVARGAEPAVEPHRLEDDNGVVWRAAVRTYGDVIHSFIADDGYKGAHLPGYESRPLAGTDVGLKCVDHVVGNVELGRMDEWAAWYEKVLGFQRYISFDDKDISTEYTALMSIVMSDDSHQIKFPINEPAPGRKTSQIEEYLNYHGGPGVQHIALLTPDILATVRALRQNGVEFLDVPDSYYQDITARVGTLSESIDELRELGVLADRDENGYLLQIFTKPVEDRPTLFYELIERKGSTGFGKGNFKALFEAIEREQSLRGNL